MGIYAMVQKKGIKLKKNAPKKEERKTVEKYLKEYSDDPGAKVGGRGYLSG